jgi:hypothetical protein
LSRTARAAIAALAPLVLASPAHAHSAFGNVTPFWSGVLHTAVSPLALAALIGFAAALAPAQKPRVFPNLVAAMAAAFAASWLGQTIAALAPTGAIIVGLIGALDVGRTRIAGFVIGVSAGFSVGLAAEVDRPTLVAGLGVASAVFFVGGAAYAVFDKIEERLQPARRIVGAWVAATALLLGALALVRAS